MSEWFNTPLVQEEPSGRSTELTEHGPISHLQERAVALASNGKET